jgi:hypothetical protein
MGWLLAQFLHAVLQYLQSFLQHLHAVLLLLHVLARLHGGVLGLWGLLCWHGGVSCRTDVACRTGLRDGCLWLTKRAGKQQTAEYMSGCMNAHAL